MIFLPNLVILKECTHIRSMSNVPSISSKTHLLTRHSGVYTLINLAFRWSSMGLSWNCKWPRHNKVSLSRWSFLSLNRPDVWVLSSFWWSPCNRKNACNFIISFLFVSFQWSVLDLSFRLGVFSKNVQAYPLVSLAITSTISVYKTTQNIPGCYWDLLNQDLCQACQ
jgi:hypothetical protein